MVELTNANLELNLAHSNLLNILQNQAHGILVLKTPSQEQFAGIDDGDPNRSHAEHIETDRRIDVHDPNKMVTLTYGINGEEPKLESLEQAADFAGAVESIRFLANSLANTMGLDHGVFEVQVSTNPATVFHINEKRRQAIVQEYQSIFIDAERELFTKSYKVAKLSDPSIADIDTKTYSVEFSPEKAIVSNMTSKDVLDLKAAGIIDTIEAIRQHYGSLSRTEAFEFLEEMVEDEQQVRKVLEKLNIVKPAEEPTPENPEEKQGDGDIGNDTL
jgi:hypothetical protein